MKNILCLPLCFLLALPVTLVSQHYTTGDTLHVVATSGLRLRTSPHFDAGTIRILPYAEQVHVLNTFDFSSSHRASTGWMTGSWIKVSVRGVEGYAHDGFLTTLDLPDHEDELCDDTQYIYPALEAYLRHHYPVIHDHHGSEHREDLDQCITYHRERITLTRTLGAGWQKTDVLFQDYRLSEVINLFRSMLIGDTLRGAFEDSLKFYQNRQGEVFRLQAAIGQCVLHIELQSPHTVHVAFTEFTAG